jgi:hypothetical protein
MMEWSNCSVYGQIQVDCSVYGQIWVGCGVYGRIQVGCGDIRVKYGRILVGCDGLWWAVVVYGQIQSDLRWYVARFSRIAVVYGQIQSDCGGIWPDSVGLWWYMAKVGRIAVVYGQSRSDCGGIWPKSVGLRWYPVGPRWFYSQTQSDWGGFMVMFGDGPQSQ